MSGAELTESGGDEVIPLTKIRRLIAHRMVQSKATSPHTLMARELDYEAADSVRREHAAAFKEAEGFSLTYLSFSACATVQALREFPYLNASVLDEALVVHRAINLGIAVDLPQGGLVVPVIHGAQDLTLRQMALAIHDVAERARAAKLGMDDITGGTFTITNTGPFATLLTGAIINQPEVAILATDGVARRPVVVTSPDGDETIAVRPIGIASINFDHRALDGAYVARFLARLAEILHGRDWAGEL